MRGKAGSERDYCILVQSKVVCWGNKDNFRPAHLGLAGKREAGERDDLH